MLNFVRNFNQQQKIVKYTLQISKTTLSGNLKEIKDKKWKSTTKFA